MNLGERIGGAIRATLEALGEVGPFDEVWGGVDPRLEWTGQDRLAKPESAAESDEQRWPAA